MGRPAARHIARKPSSPATTPRRHYPEYYGRATERPRAPHPPQPLRQQAQRPRRRTPPPPGCRRPPHLRVPPAPLPLAIVAGDLNDHPRSGSLDALLKRTHLVDAMALEQYRGPYPGTYQRALRHRKTRLPPPLTRPATQSRNRRRLPQRLLRPPQVGVLRKHRRQQPRSLPSVGSPLCLGGAAHLQEN
jgi:hypothetical protein